MAGAQRGLGLPILIPSGVVFFSAVEDDYSAAASNHNQPGLPIERMGPATGEPVSDDRLFRVEVGLFEPKFGALMRAASVLRSSSLSSRAVANIGSVQRFLCR